MESRGSNSVAKGGANEGGRVQPLTEEQIRASFVNAPTGAIERMPLPGLHETVWEDREYLGWLDPTLAQRGSGHVRGERQQWRHWSLDAAVAVSVGQAHPCPAQNTGSSQP